MCWTESQELFENDFHFLFVFGEIEKKLGFEWTTNKICPLIRTMCNEKERKDEERFAKEMVPYEKEMVTYKKELKAYEEYMKLHTKKQTLT